MTPVSPGQPGQSASAKGAGWDATAAPNAADANLDVLPVPPFPSGSGLIRRRYSLEPEGLASMPIPTPEVQAAPTEPLPRERRGPAAPGAAPVTRAEPAAGRRERPVPASMYRVLDNTLALGVLVAALILRNVGRMPNGLDDFLTIRLSLKNVLLLLGFVAAWRGICALCGLYDFRRIASWRSEARGVLAACFLGGTVGLAFPLTSASGAFDYLALALFWGGTTLGMLGLRCILRFAARVRPRPARNVLIVGTGPRALHMKECLQADPDVDYRVIGFVDSDSAHATGPIRQRIVASLEDFDATLMHSPVDEVVVALPMKSHYAQIQHIVEFCESIGVAVTLPADAFRSSRSAFRPRPSPSMLAVTLADTPDGAGVVMKRGFDVIGASLALVVLAPLMVLTALMVKLTSRGPVLFTQERYGYNRRIFRMYKFRTMVVDAESLQSSLEHLNEASGPLFKIRRDPRLTLIGGFLRRTSIDELPQLFNVLWGEMSLVGPRPMAIRDVHLFPAATLMRRFSVPAGMTGLWQVTGRSTLNYGDWAACDLRYVEQWSLLGDFKILALTIPAVLRGTGAQ
jgi:exopolysaccharide biosynthesis polyprenyl glycosylphosphotransferase